MKRLITLFTTIFILSNLFSQNNIAYLNAPTKEIAEHESEKAITSITNFEIVNGMILVEASLDGEQGNFILDTGAPGIILNSKCKESSSDVKANGIAGTINVEEIELNDFKWSIIQQEKITGYKLDISHLEGVTNQSIKGLIGYDVIKNYELFFDYENKQIRIFNSKKSELHKTQKPSSAVSFFLDNHLPIIRAKIGDKKINLALDTGAEINLINEAIYDKLNLNSMSNHRVEELRGLDKNIKRNIAADLESTIIGKQEISNMRFLFTDFTFLKSHFEHNVDGLLGFPLFQSSKISINYYKKKIYFWD